MRRDAALSAVDHSSLADAAGPEVLFLLRSAENLGATVEILDLTAAGGLLPVALARLTDPETGAVRWATGSGLRHRDAVRAALRDLLGAEQLRDAADGPDTGDPLWPDLDASTLVAETAVPLPDTGTTWAAVLDGLAAGLPGRLRGGTAHPRPRGRSCSRGARPADPRRALCRLRPWPPRATGPRHGNRCPPDRGTRCAPH
nr:hypothetical protein [Streptomyces sp. RPA4-2]